MKLSQIKEVKEFCKVDLFSTPDWREVVAHIADEDEDFEVDGVRFIHKDAIDGIQQNELSGDKYILGCFNDWFIADVLGIDVDVIQAMQKAEAFEAIGKLIISMGKLEELQEAYASTDGYGHHFNQYDFGEEQIGEYYVFDNH